ncbi:MAG: phenylalanine--tRNA ligase subunit beta [Candidatus Microgenomates bacterium]
MKIPLNWLKDYVETNKSPREIAASFTQLGLMLDKPLDNSGVLDLEHRMDRSDWLSIMGCARDYAAFEKIKLKYPKTATKKPPKVSPDELVEITVNSKAVRRFNTRVVKNLKVGESPEWLKERLTAYGIKSINNVVDITNYVMVELGQPMHAQDLAKLKKREITIRPAKAGETVKTILGTTVNLDKEIFVLSSGGVATVIGGIVGGLDSSVTNDTTEIILDAGNYDQSVIRKNSRRLKIINETVSRYDKFLHPDLCEIALDRATYLLETIANATVYLNFDYYPNIVKPVSMTLTYKRLKTISGMELPIKDIKRILTALEYQIVDETNDSLKLVIPYFRTDVEVEDDVVADILRINDYSNIPTTPLSTPVPKDITPTILTFEEHLRDLLVAQGAHEHITASLVKESGISEEILLSNALSSDQNALRISAKQKLLEIQINYKKHQVEDAVIFEIGKSFSQTNGDYREKRELTIVGHTVTSPITTLMHQLGIKHFVSNTGEIMVSNTPIGKLEVGSATLDTALLMQYQQKYQGIISDFRHEVKRDISLIAPNNVTYFDITSVIESTKPKFRYNCKSVTQVSDHINYLLTLSWLSPSESVDTDTSSLIKILESKLKIKSKS